MKYRNKSTAALRKIRYGVNSTKTGVDKAPGEDQR
jgi:hypothetical protein